MIVLIQNIDAPEDYLSFEFDERHFTGLMRKYRTASEVRKMIISLFSTKEKMKS